MFYRKNKIQKKIYTKEFTCKNAQKPIKVTPFDGIYLKCVYDRSGVLEIFC